MKPPPAGGIELGHSGTALRGRIVALLPDAQLPGLGEMPYSRRGNSVADIEDVYNRALMRQVGGVVDGGVS